MDNEARQKKIQEDALGARKKEEQDRRARDIESRYEEMLKTTTLPSFKDPAYINNLYGVPDTRINENNA